jgi:hypothetical protein
MLSSVARSVGVFKHAHKQIAGAHLGVAEEQAAVDPAAFDGTVT